jgi:TrmH family RNA methyltransferase
MLTKATAKHVKDLQEKKHRTASGEFLVEGEKNVAELLNSDFEIVSLFSTREFQNKYREALDATKIKYDLVEQAELEKMGSLESNDAAIAVVKQKENESFEIGSEEIILALDDVRDPGNLGTIIRIADWYGITKIVASPTTTDFYNSKTISATRGSFTRVAIYYTELESFIKNKNKPILGAFLEGENVHTMKFPTGGILLMGSESHGINEKLSKIVTQKITIPQYGEAESLNVSIATAVILDNWKRSK